MSKSLVITEGFSEIADGREFVVDADGADGGKPGIYPPGGIKWNPEDVVVGVVRPGVDLVCPKCAELRKRHLLCHTLGWMYTAYVCPNHPNEYLLDFFPKTCGGDTQWDYTNAFMADLDSVANPRLPEGVEITNYKGPGERYAWYRDGIMKTSAYRLTPNGVISPSSPQVVPQTVANKESRAGVGAWLQGLWTKWTTP